jgi:hypothetical protein
MRGIEILRLIYIFFEARKSETQRTGRPFRTNVERLHLSVCFLVYRV